MKFQRKKKDKYVPEGAEEVQFNGFPCNGKLVKRKTPETENSNLSTFQNSQLQEPFNLLSEIKKMVRSKETRHFNSHHNDKRRAILKRRSIIKGTNNRSRKCRHLKQVPCILNFELSERGDWLPRFIPLGEASVVFLRVVSVFLP